jgi:Predicted 3'-5' exonuclease related to the exonuclease domain of PolB
VTDYPKWASPFLSRVAAIYVKRETGLPIAFLPNEAQGVASAGIEVKLCKDEKDMLATFWATMAQIDQVAKERIVTFNGRKFTVPFLYIRSSVQGVAATNVDLLRDRYKMTEHVDLLEAYTFHGIIPKPNFLQLAALYGFPLPVTQEGDDMQKLLTIGLTVPNPALWNMLLKSGLDYAGTTLSLGAIWARTLRLAY